jgi:hypothetical protein
MRRVVGSWFLAVVLGYGTIRGVVDGDTRDTPFMLLLTLLAVAASVWMTMRRFGRDAFYGIKRRGIQ